jgi:DNA-binding HxlR family transcriptional regulator
MVDADSRSLRRSAASRGALVLQRRVAADAEELTADTLRPPLPSSRSVRVFPFPCCPYQRFVLKMLQGGNDRSGLPPNAEAVPNCGVSSAPLPRCLPPRPTWHPARWICTSLVHRGQRGKPRIAPRSPSPRCFDRGQVSCQPDNFSSTLRQPSGRLVAISTRTPTERLRLLEAGGWVSRHYEPTVPPQVTYALTERVLELQAVIEELDRIAERWYGKGATES